MARIESDCDTILLQVNYQKHLLSKSHINYWNNYLLYKSDD